MLATVTLKIHNGPDTGREIVFRVPHTFLIGRSRDCDLTLPPREEYLSISRHHCELGIDPPHVWVRDMGSTNGTFVNGVRLQTRVQANDTTAVDGLAAQELHPGDEVQVGPLVVEVTATVPADSTDC